MATSAIEAEGLVKTFGKVRALDGIDMVAGRGPCSACSGRTAPGRRPPSGSCRPCCSRTRGGPRSGATTSCASPRRSAADRADRPVRGGGRAALGPGEPVHDRAVARLPRAAAEPAPRSSSRRSTCPTPRRRSSRRTRVGCGGGWTWRRAWSGARAPVPGRADDRSGPAEPDRALGDDPGARGARARPCCSRPSTWKRPTASPTRSW